jgi:hypothetical protein
LIENTPLNRDLLVFVLRQIDSDSAAAHSDELNSIEDCMRNLPYRVRQLEPT